MEFKDTIKFLPSATLMEQRAVYYGQRLTAILDSINNGVLATALRKDGSVESLFVSDRFYELLGYTREQFDQEISDPFAVIVSQSREDIRQKTAALRCVGEHTTMITQAVRREGRCIWLRVDLSIVSFIDVSVPVQLSVFTDITASVEADNRLKAQQAQLAQILDSTPGGIAVVELDPEHPVDSMHTIYYNDHFYSYSGYDREEYDRLLRCNEFYFVLDEDIPILLSSINQICITPGVAVDCTVRCRTKAGGYRYLLLTGVMAERRERIFILNIVCVDITEKKEAEDQRRISEELLRIAAQSEQQALMIYDVKANACRVESHSLCGAAYAERIAPMPHALLARGMVSPDSERELLDLFRSIHAGEERIKVSLQMLTEPNVYQWFECSAVVVFDADHAPDHAVLVFQNITEQRLKEAVFQKWQQSIRARAPASYTLFRCNLSQNARLDARAGELLSIQYPDSCMSFNERTAEYAGSYVCPEDRAAYLALLQKDYLLTQYYRGERNTELEYREISPDGELLWRRLTVELVEYLYSTDVHAFLMYEDIHRQKLEELWEKERAETDPLTGALNRAAFFEKADAFIRRECSAQHVLMMLEIRNVSELNDAFGYAAGDQALTDAVATLRSIIYDSDLLCRLSGGDFMILLHQIPYDAVVKKKAGEICSLISRTYSPEVRLSVNVGISVYPRDGQNIDALFHCADKALFSARQAGANTYAFYGKALRAVEDAQAVSSSSVVPPIARPGQKRRMLVVDHGNWDQELLQELFHADFHVEIAANGYEAMTRMRHYGLALSIVLLDLMLPDMDGCEVLKRMQNNADLRTIPVIVVSAAAGYETLLKAIECGAADYVTQPIDLKLLRIRVQSAISKAENERLRAQNSYLLLQRNEELKYQTALQSAGMVVVEYDWRSRLFTYDKSISRHLAGKYDGRALFTVFLTDMVADTQDVKRLQSAMLELANHIGCDSVSELIRLKTPSRHKHWFRMNIYKQTGSNHLPTKMILTFSDVHEEVLATQKLKYQATMDELTGIYNRSGFLERAAELIAEKEPGYYILSCIDIHNFKVINDQYGNETGDEVLRRFASTLSRLDTSPNSICCRVMADIFALLYPRSLLGSEALAQSHHKAEVLSGLLPPIKYYVGRCVVDNKALSVSAIFDRATIAKDTVKGRYDIYIATYSESMRTDILREQSIISRMKPALEQGQFEVWLQPQYNHSSGAVVGAEALVRWRSPDEGLILPSVFIPIFERNGFIYEMDRFVWEQVCKSLRLWLEEGQHPVPISVNISRYDLIRPDIVDVLWGLLQKYCLPVELLRLEITETALSKSTQTILPVIRQLVALGFTVEIDDFGSGYSSLNTLKDVPAQVLKLDMKFFENTADSQRSGNIVASVVRMAKWLGMSIIAEGVELREQADFLKTIGCSFIQGYYYARPMPIAEYAALVISSKTQHKFDRVNTVERFDSSAFWDAKSLDTMVFNHFSGGAFIFEYNQGRFEMLRVNDAFAKVLHSDLSNEEILALEPFAAFRAEDHARLTAAVKCAYEGGRAETCDVYSTQYCKPGEGEYIRVTIRRIAACQGRLLFYGYVDNLTALVRAREEIQQTSDRIHAIMENASCGIAAVVLGEQDIQQVILVNDRFYELVGYTRESYAAAGHTGLCLMHPDDRALFRKEFDKLNMLGASASYEIRVRHRDGRWRWLRSDVSVIRLNDITAPVQLASLTDITARVEAQNAALESNAKLNAILDSLSSAVFVAQPEGGRMRHVFSNGRLHELMGYDASALSDAASGFYDAIDPSDRARVRAVICRSLEVHEPQSVEYRFTRSDGTRLWLRHRLVTTGVAGVGSQVLISIIDDITEQKTAQPEGAGRNATNH